MSSSILVVFTPLPKQTSFLYFHKVYIVSAAALFSNSAFHPFPLVPLVIHHNSSSHSNGTWSKFIHLRTLYQTTFMLGQPKNRWLRDSAWLQKQHLPSVVTPNLQSLFLVGNLPWQAIQKVNMALGRATFLYIVTFQSTIGYSFLK
jgi:hypothetical protein